MTAEEITAVFKHAANLKKRGRYAEAVDFLQPLARKLPNAPIAHFKLATMLARSGKPHEAMSSYQRCLELSPDHAGALLGLGHTLKALGKYDQCIHYYKQCIEHRPDQGEAYFSLANLKTYRFDDAGIEEMEQQVAKESISDNARLSFFFALGKAYEDRNDYRTSWKYYERGNAIKRVKVKYDPVRTESTANEIIRHFSADYFAQTARGGHSDDSPIFVLGLPRSGSTLIEQILASHSMIEGCGELPYIQRLTLAFDKKTHRALRYPAILKRLDSRKLMLLGVRYLELASGSRTDTSLKFVDKMPGNFLHIGFIHSILPNAKIIDARRHPLDTCVSNLKQLYNGGQNYCYDQSEIGEYYLQYQRVMDHWDEVIPERVLRVQYEDTVTDLEGQVRRILDYLELPWEDRCMRYFNNTRPVHTPSSEQVRLPIYQRGIGDWSHFDSELAELKAVLSPILAAYT